MKKLFIYLCFLFFLIAGFYACDSTTAPENTLKDNPTVTHFLVSPKEIVFSQEHGFIDTTFTVTVEAGFTQIDSSNIPLIVVTDKNSGNVILDQSMKLADVGINTYTLNFDISTTTTSYEDYILSMIYDEEQGNYAQTNLQITGFSNTHPVILETQSPGTINRPETGEIPAIFTAKVTDTDGQETIDAVYLRVISQETGEVTGSPFEMFDDGSSFNDEVAKDSTFTWFQQITPTDNNPNRDYNIEFFAIDKGGLSSDTIRTTFHIRD